MISTAPPAESEAPDVETDFRLDLSVIMAATPVAALLRSTSDNCGSSCPNACASRASYPD
jgi:FxLD family lantipeptide